MSTDHSGAAQAFCPRGTHVIHPEHIEHARPQHARVPRTPQQSYGQRGQHQVRGCAIPAKREDRHLERECIQEEQADPERRSAHAEQDGNHQRSVLPATVVQGSRESDRQADEHLGDRRRKR